MSGGRVVNSAVRVPEQPFARARLALRAKNMLFPSGCACNPRGRPAKPKPCRPSVPCASNEYPRAENPRVAGRRARIMTAHKKALLRRTDDCIHPCRFANAGSFLQFILPTAADEGAAHRLFCGRQRGLAPDLDRRLLPCRTGRQDGRFLKRLGRLFSGFGVLFKIEMGGKPF